MIEQKATLGVVLAGGQSRRMNGIEKGLLELEGVPLAIHTMRRLAAQTGGIILNANGNPARFAGHGATVVPDTVSGFAGPLAGILAAMQWAAVNRPQTSHIVSAAADTPFFPEKLAEQFRAVAPSSGSIVLARSTDIRHPVFGMWPVAIAGDLESFLRSGENPKVMLFVQRFEHTHADFAYRKAGAERLDPFFNINTPADYERAKSIAEHVNHEA